MKGYEEKLEEWIGKLGKVSTPDFYDVYRKSDGRLMLCKVTAEKAAHFAGVSPNFVILSSKPKHKVATETGYYFEQNNDEIEMHLGLDGRYRLKARYYEQIKAEAKRQPGFWRRGWITESSCRQVRSAGCRYPENSMTLVNIAEYLGLPVMDVVEVMRYDS